VNLQKETTNIKEACKANTVTAKQTVASLEKSLRVSQALQGQLGKLTQKTPFEAHLTQFLATVSNQITEASRLLEKSISDFEATTILYGEDPKLTNPEEFFGHIQNFVSNFIRCHQENEQHKLKLADKAKKEQLKKVFPYFEHPAFFVTYNIIKEREQALLTKRSQTSLVVPDSSTSLNVKESEGEFDDLIQSIRSGEAFSVKSRQTHQRSRRGTKSSADGSGTNIVPRRVRASGVVSGRNSLVL